MLRYAVVCATQNVLRYGVGHCFVAHIPHYFYHETRRNAAVEFGLFHDQLLHRIATEC